MHKVQYSDLTVPQNTLPAHSYVAITYSNSLLTYFKVSAKSSTQTLKSAGIQVGWATLFWHARHSL